MGVRWHFHTYARKSKAIHRLHRYLRNLWIDLISWTEVQAP